jgi:hypothetical protein
VQGLLDVKLPISCPKRGIHVKLIEMKPQKYSDLRIIQKDLRNWYVPIPCARMHCPMQLGF